MLFLFKFLEKIIHYLAPIFIKIFLKRTKKGPFVSQLQQKVLQFDIFKEHYVSLAC